MTIYKPKNDSLIAFIVIVLVIVMIPLACAGIGWYRAGVQAEVYCREGIYMTQWEVFVGAKPAERTININEEKR